jgi:hypothetical protein
MFSGPSVEKVNAKLLKTPVLNVCLSWHLPWPIGLLSLKFPFMELNFLSTLHEIF